jgi:hypothetical protein
LAEDCRLLVRDRELEALVERAGDLLCHKHKHCRLVQECGEKHDLNEVLLSGTEHKPAKVNQEEKPVWMVANKEQIRRDRRSVPVPLETDKVWSVGRKMEGARRLAPRCIPSVLLARHMAHSLRSDRTNARAWSLRHAPLHDSAAQPAERNATQQSASQNNYGRTGSSCAMSARAAA